MKFKFLITLATAATILANAVSSLAQANWERIGANFGGVPKKESPAEIARRNFQARQQHADGQIYRSFQNIELSIGLTVLMPVISQSQIFRQMP